MTDYELERHKQQNALERIRVQADLREQAKVRAEAFDVEVEQVRGDNERRLARLHQEIAVENRNLDVQHREIQNAQQLRLEALQTAVKQHDDFFRHFWAMDQEVLGLETRIIEIIVKARVEARQTTLTHRQSMEAKQSDQLHELTVAHQRNELDKDNFEFKERLKIQLAREFGLVNQDNINAAVDRMFKEGTLSN